jgi:hypothetical protein
MVLGIGRGSSGVIEDATDADVRRIVGEQFDQVASSDGKFTVYIHELWLVADLPLNAAASAMAGVVIGGPAVIIPLDQETPVDKTFNPTFHSFLIERAVVIEDKLEALYEQNRTQKNFVLVDSDRWIYNGKVFAAIVVSSDEEPDDSEPRRHNIWFFAPGSMDPFSVRMVDYSLREVLEDLILGDEAAAEGRIQETFRAPLQHFGLI